MPVSKQVYSNRGRVVSVNKKSIFKKIIDKGIDALSKLERKYIQGIDYKEDPLFQKERNKQNKEEHDKLFKPKAYGGKAKMAGGGKLKDVPSGNKGLGKLPTAVRNKMGFKKYGGKAKMMGGGKVHMKKYAKGGGMRKAQTHG